MPKAIAICGTVTDEIIHLEKLPQPNQGSRLLGRSIQFGGNAATAIVACSMGGVDSGLIATTGDDDFGKAQKVDFERHGVDTSHLIFRKGIRTGYVVAISDAETGSRSLCGARYPQKPIEPEDLDMDYLATAKYLLLDGNTPATHQAAQAVLARGGEVMCDAGWWTQEKEDMAAWSTYYIASEFFLETKYGKNAKTAGDDDVVDACKDMMKMGPKVVIFTLGKRGLVGVGPEGVFKMPCIDFGPVVDTTGCGDTFHGAYIAGVEHGYNAEGAARWASVASGIKSTAMGGRAGQAPEKVIMEYLRGGKPDLSFIKKNEEYYQTVHYELVERLK